MNEGINSQRFIRSVLITGGNRGIGFQTTKDLALLQNVGKVIFTYRRLVDGEKAMNELVTKFKVPRKKLDMHPLEIRDEKSILNLKKYIREKYGSISVLVNNAAIIFRRSDVHSEDITVENAKSTFLVNFEGTISITEMLDEMIDEKIIHVSSMSSQLNFTNMEVRNRFWKARSIEDLRKAFQSYVSSIEAKTTKEDGYDTIQRFPSYGLTKLCLTVATRIQAENETRGRIICCFCPGFIKTDMTNHHENAKPIELASRTPVHVIMNSNEDWHGGFFRRKDQRVVLFDS